MNRTTRRREVGGEARRHAPRRGPAQTASLQGRINYKRRGVTPARPPAPSAHAVLRGNLSDAAGPRFQKQTSQARRRLCLATPPSAAAPTAPRCPLVSPIPAPPCRFLRLPTPTGGAPCMSPPPPPPPPPRRAPPSAPGRPLVGSRRRRCRGSVAFQEDCSHHRAARGTRFFEDHAVRVCAGGGGRRRWGGARLAPHQSNRITRKEKQHALNGPGQRGRRRGFLAGAGFRCGRGCGREHPYQTAPAACARPRRGHPLRQQRRRPPA